MQMGSSGDRSNFRGRHKQMSEINVTPFVDVMLVLLVVFMVAAPLLTTGVKVNLPQAKAKSLPDNNKAITVTITNKGLVSMSKDEVMTLQELVTKLQFFPVKRKTETIYIRGDKDVDYGRVMKVISGINGAGFSKVALVTDRDR
jgi:biopolymer transport protein TolR